MLDRFCTDRSYSVLDLMRETNGIAVIVVVLLFMFDETLYLLQFFEQKVEIANQLGVRLFGEDAQVCI